MPAVIFHDDNDKVFESNSIMNKVTKESIDKIDTPQDESIKNLVDRFNGLRIDFKRGFFNRIFPDAPSYAYDVCVGKVKIDRKTDGVISHDLRNNQTILPVSNGIYIKKDESGRHVGYFGSIDPYETGSDQNFGKANEKKPSGNILEKAQRKVFSSGTSQERTVTNTDGKNDQSITQGREINIVINKKLRKNLDEVIQALKSSARKSPERSTAIRKITEGVMWLGMDLKAIGEDNPYPNSKNPNNTTIDKTADGLKL